jgi:hypothetical protein
MTAILIISPTDLVAPAVREFLLRKHGLAKPDMVRDERGLQRIRSRCECCRAVMSSSMQYQVAEESHARSLAHVCHEMGVQDYITEARQLSTRLARRHTLREALAILGDSTARADLFAAPKR